MSAPNPLRAVTSVVAALALLGIIASGAVPGEGLRGVVRVAGKPQRDVVVWLDGVPGPAPSSRPRVVLDQRNMAFLPHVLAVRVGTRVEMPNNDRVFHNVFSFKNGKRFDLGLYPVGTTKVVEFDRPGLSRIFCNIHPTMAAYVMALEASHFAVSGSDGRFNIAEVPAGRYQYHAWRPGGDMLTGTVTSAAGQPLEVAWP